MVGDTVKNITSESRRKYLPQRVMDKVLTSQRTPQSNKKSNSIRISNSRKIGKALYQVTRLLGSRYVS